MEKIPLAPIVSRYIPFYTFEADVTSDYMVEHGLKDEKTNDIAYFHEQGRLPSSKFGPTTFCADSEMEAHITGLIYKIKTWNTLLATSPIPISNQQFVIDKFESHEEVWKKFAIHIKESEMENARRKIVLEKNSSVVKNVIIKSAYSNVVVRLIYLPSYITSFEYASKRYFIVMNAQTGEVSANRPYGLGTLGQIGGTIGSYFFGGAEKKKEEEKS